MIGSRQTGLGSARTGDFSVRTASDSACSGGGGPSPPAPSNLMLWFRGDAGATQSDGLVTAWADQSGHGRNVAAIVGDEPAFIADAIDDKPGIQFDFHKRLENTTDSIPTGARTVMAVAQAMNTMGGTLIAFRRGVRDWAAQLWREGGTQYVWTDGVSNISHLIPVDYSGAPRLIEHTQSSGNNLAVRVDGVPLALNASATTNENAGPGFVIGNRAQDISGAQWWAGPLCELLVWNKVLSSPETADAIAYFLSRYPSLVVI
jgi:hypothetical protein